MPEWCPHFGTLGDPREHPGGALEQQDGHSWVRNSIFSDLGTPCGKLLGDRGLNSVFVSSLFPGRFLYRFVNLNPTVWEFNNKAVSWKVLQKTKNSNSSHKSFL